MADERESCLAGRTMHDRTQTSLATVTSDAVRGGEGGSARGTSGTRKGGGCRERTEDRDELLGRRAGLVDLWLAGHAGPGAAGRSRGQGVRGRGGVSRRALLRRARRARASGRREKWNGGGDAHLGVGADNGPDDARALSDGDTVEQDAVPDPCTGLDDRARADGDVGPELGRLVDRRRRVHIDRSFHLWPLSTSSSRRRKEFRRVLGKVLEVRRRCGQGRAGSLDLPPEVGRLEREELAGRGETGDDVLLEVDDVVGLGQGVLAGGKKGRAGVGRGGSAPGLEREEEREGEGRTPLPLPCRPSRP